MMQQLLKYIKEADKAEKMANTNWGTGLQAQIQPQQASINAAQAATTAGWIYAQNGNYYNAGAFGNTVSFSPKAKEQMDAAEEAHKLNVTPKELLHDINSLLSTIKALRGGA